MVEGARLESVYRGNSIQGSNPCLSAILFSIRYTTLVQYGIQRLVMLRERRARVTFQRPHASSS